MPKKAEKRKKTDDLSRWKKNFYARNTSNPSCRNKASFPIKKKMKKNKQKRESSCNRNMKHIQ